MNGMRGIVQKLDKKYVEVLLEDGNIIKVKTVTFKRYEPNSKHGIY